MMRRAPYETTLSPLTRPVRMSKADGGGVQIRQQPKATYHPRGADWQTHDPVAKIVTVAEDAIKEIEARAKARPTPADPDLRIERIVRDVEAITQILCKRDRDLGELATAWARRAIRAAKVVLRP